MNEIEKKKFMDVVKGFDDDEKSVAVMLLPTNLLWDELRRREELERETLIKAREALGLGKEDENEIRDAFKFIKCAGNS